MSYPECYVGYTNDSKYNLKLKMTISKKTLCRDDLVVSTILNNPQLMLAKLRYNNEKLKVIKKNIKINITVKRCKNLL